MRLSYTATTALLRPAMGAIMKFVAGSNLPDDALQRLAQDMVDAHGGQARDVVNRLIDAANGDSDFAAHAKWINVSLAVLQILRPAR